MTVAPACPPNGIAWLVRFQDTRGMTVTKIFRQITAASRYMDLVESIGGHPELWQSELRWSPAGDR